MLADARRVGPGIVVSSVGARRRRARGPIAASRSWPTWSARQTSITAWAAPRRARPHPPDTESGRPGSRETNPAVRCACRRARSRHRSRLREAPLRPRLDHRPDEKPRHADAAERQALGRTSRRVGHGMGPCSIADEWRHATPEPARESKGRMPARPDSRDPIDDQQRSSEDGERECEVDPGELAAPGHVGHGRRRSRGGCPRRGAIQKFMTASTRATLWSGRDACGGRGPITDEVLPHSGGCGAPDLMLT
jgi:hypothetical protein